MKHSHLTIFIFLLCHAGWLASQQSVFPDSLTDRHQLIGGTNVALIPPAGFETAANFKGFQRTNDESSLIMLMELPGPYEEVSAGMNEANLSARGIKLTALEEMEVYGYTGTFVGLEQPANGLTFSKWILIYGDSLNTTFINGIYLKDSLVVGEAIKRSLLTTFIERGMTVDPRQALGFTIDESVGKLTFNAVIGNGILLTRDGKTPTESPDDIFLMADHSFSAMEIRDREQFCIARLDSYPDSYQLDPKKEIEAITIDGLPGFALYADNLDDPSERMYQVILFPEEGGYYIMVGSWRKGVNKARKDVLRVIETFKRR